jgi:hypothetical protein
MNSANLRLSEEERQLISSVDWILTKNRLMGWTKDKLAELQLLQLNLLQDLQIHLPAEVLAIPPKISRGENYEGLPWLMLDLPRFFTTTDQMAIRSFFWWGHGFSTTLQLAGSYQAYFRPALIQAFEKLKDEGWMYCMNSDPWQHHFRADNYRSLSELDSHGWEKHLHTHPFLKLARQTGMDAWEQVPELLSEQYRYLLNVLCRKAD